MHRIVFGHFPTYWEVTKWGTSPSSVDITNFKLITVLVILGNLILLSSPTIFTLVEANQLLAHLPQSLCVYFAHCGFGWRRLLAI